MNEDNLVNLGTAGASTAGNIISTVLTNRANAKLAEQANQWSLEQWQRENEYNLPVHQLERLRQAGINPNLAYANGSPMNEAAGSPAVTSAAGTQVAPHVDPYMMSQVNLMNAQAENQRAEARNKDKESTLKDFEIRVQQLLDDGGVDKLTNQLTDNMRVRHWMYENHLINLQGDMAAYQVQDLIWNLAVTTGSDEWLGSYYSHDSDSLTYARGALRGDQRVRSISAEIAELNKSMLKAQDQSREAYNQFIEAHKDNPLVQFLLILTGFMKSNGISIPGFSFGSSNSVSAGEKSSSMSKSRSFGVR